MARLIRTDWPDFGTPNVPPAFALAEARRRLAMVREGMTRRGYAALLVYGDREHAANLHWITGFDPRFEEAVLVVTPGDALLIAGNECLPYTGISPLVQAGDVRVAHCAALSLPSQPRGGRRLAAQESNKKRDDQSVIPLFVWVGNHDGYFEKTSILNLH